MFLRLAELKSEVPDSNSVGTVSVGDWKVSSSISFIGDLVLSGLIKVALLYLFRTGVVTLRYGS